MITDKLPLLRVSENKRHLVTENGDPFFWLGDTTWEIFHRLNAEEAVEFLECRAVQGFNVIQSVALAEFDGLTVPNAYGRFPLLKNAEGIFDPTLPDLESGTDDNHYWAHVDRIIGLASDRGIYVGLLPTWGDKYNTMWGKGPDIFTTENARAYGLWIGRRYCGCTNIVWILGGDRPLKTRRHFEIIKAMAEGIREGDEGKHLITFHPSGESSSSDYVHDEEWLDFNMIQSGHGKLNLETWEFIKADWDKTPVKPTLDGEPRYEDHPIGFNPVNGYFDAADVRQAAWWGVMAGGLGVTYGHHSIWSMNRESEPYFPLNWRQAMVRPAAGQMRFLKQLALSRPMLERIPDQDLVVEQYEGASRILAARGEAYAFLYSPSGLKINVQLGRIRGRKVHASWFNPRTGFCMEIGIFPNEGTHAFLPVLSGRGEDWVLVLDGVET
jgi:hypothetical protein